MVGLKNDQVNSRELATVATNKVDSYYISYKEETLAVVWAISYFRPYLYGRRFTLVTDQKPLIWLMGSDKVTSKLIAARFFLKFLSNLVLSINDRFDKGKDHK